MNGDVAAILAKDGSFQHDDSRRSSLQRSDRRPTAVMVSSHTLGQVPSARRVSLDSAAVVSPTTSPVSLPRAVGQESGSSPSVGHDTLTPLINFPSIFHPNHKNGPHRIPVPPVDGQGSSTTNHEANINKRSLSIVSDMADSSSRGMTRGSVSATTASRERQPSLVKPTGWRSSSNANPRTRPRGSVVAIPRHASKGGGSISAATASTAIVQNVSPTDRTASAQKTEETRRAEERWAKVRRWAKVCRVKKFAQEHMDRVAAKEQEQLQRARNVLVRFLRRYARKLRFIVLEKQIRLRTALSTLVNAHLRQKQSQEIVQSKIAANFHKSMEKVRQLWRSSKTFRSFDNRRTDVDDRLLMKQEEDMDRRDVMRRERNLFLELSMLFDRHPLTKAIREVRKHEQLRTLRVAAVMKRGGIDLNKLFSFVGLEKLEEDPTPRSKRIDLVSRGKMLQAGGDGAGSALQRVRSVAMMIPRRFLRRNSAILLQMTGNGNNVRLADLLGASSNVASLEQQGTSSSEVLAMLEVSNRERDHQLNEDGSNVEMLQQTISPLLLHLAMRASGTFSNQNSKQTQQRLHALNDNFLHPTRTTHQDQSIVRPKHGVSDIFLGENWAVWYATNDFTKQTAAWKSRQNPHGGESRRKTAVSRRTIGGELHQARQRLSEASNGGSFSLQQDMLTSPRRGSRRRSSVFGGISDAVLERNKALMATPAPVPRRLTIPSDSAANAPLQIEYEVERLLLQEHCRRMRVVSLAERYMQSVLTTMIEERDRELSDLMPHVEVCSREASVEKVMYFYGNQ